MVQQLGEHRGCHGGLHCCGGCGLRRCVPGSEAEEAEEEEDQTESCPPRCLKWT